MSDAAVEAALREVSEETFARRVIRDTVRRRGAQFGLAWVAVVAVLAVFAPFFANSHPYLLWANGEVSSPLLEHLTWADVTWVVAFFVAVWLWMVRARTRGFRALGIGVGVVVLSAVVTQLTISPPQAVVFDKYRTGLAVGEIDRALFAPVPFSPTDRSRDNPVPLEAPSSVHWFGTDEDGADVLSRMIHACRIALSIGLVATGIAFVIGVVYGGLMGFFAGWTEILMMRFLEIFESIPQLFLLLTVVAFFGATST